MAALLPLLRCATRAAPDATDRDLLARYAELRDEDAFAELVQRHGPVVYRICNRLVGPSGAEDAFQAVFLVLATRLRSAQGAPSVAGWLVGVAGRVARQMRRSAHRRTRHESAAAETRSPECEDRTGDPTEQFRALDEELARLPDHLRDPVVLCFLQGRTQDQAAAELDRCARTLRRQLERARRVLRARLERRGVVPAVAAALLAGAGAVSAIVPPGLVHRTVAVVFDFLTGGTAAARSAPVILAKGVATTMLTRKLMLLTSAAAAALIGFGVGLAGHGPPVPASTTPTPASATPAMQPAAQSAPTMPAPVQPPLAHAAAGPELDWKAEEARTRTAVAGVQGNPNTVDTCLVIDAMCAQVSAGFCESIGLTKEDGSFAWCLTPRERRMFTALLRAEKQQGGLDVLTRPQIATEDGRTACVQVGTQAEVVTGIEREKKNGKTVYVAKLSKVDLGVSFRATPKIGASGQIQLRIEAESTELVGAGTPLAVPVAPAGETAGGESADTVRVGRLGTNKQSLQTTVVVPDGGTAVLRIASAGAPKDARETLWVLTVHIVRNNKALPAPIPASTPPAQRDVPPYPMPPGPITPPTGR
jgi:RNA polymerase sigma factor (sigma-70 family)